MSDAARATAVKAMVVSPSVPYSMAEVSNLVSAWPNDHPDELAPYQELKLRLKLIPELAIWELSPGKDIEHAATRPRIRARGD